MTSETTTTTETVNDGLNEIAETGRGTLKVRPAGETFNEHLTVREVSETTFIRIFDTSLFGEQPTAVERVIVQTRDGEGVEWSAPRVHYRDENGLTEAVDHKVIA